MNRLRKLSGAVLLLALGGLAAFSCAGSPQEVSARHMKRGDTYFAAKRYADAIIEYRGASQADPRSGLAHYQLAKAYDLSGDAPNAFREYVRAADLLPANEDAQLKTGIFLLFFGQFSDAQTRAKRALAISPTDVNALLLLGQATAGLKDLNGAVADVEGALKIDPTRSATYAVLGNLKLAQGNQAQAEAVFKSAVAANPQSSAAWLGLANYYFAAGRTTEAGPQFEKALQLDPQGVDTNRAIAAYDLATNHVAEAEAHLKLAAERSDGPQARLVLADYYYATGRLADARATLAPLDGNKPLFAPVQLRRAVVEFTDKHADLALGLIDKVLAQEPKNALALTLEGRFLLAEDRASAAEPPLKEAATIAPDSAAAHYWLGTAYYTERHFDQATSELLATLKLAPKDGEALAQLAEINLQQGKPGAALTYADQATVAQPNLIEGHVARLKALLATGAVAKAEAEGKVLNAQFQQDARAQVAVGLVSVAGHDNRSGQRAFERALALTPHDRDAISGVVTLQLADKQTGEARKLVDAELAINPNDPLLLRLSAKVFVASGDMAKAALAYQRLASLTPNDPTPYVELAHLFMARGDLEATRKQYEQASIQDPRNAQLVTMSALILQVEKRRDESIARYRQALALDPHAGFAANNLAMMYVEDKRNLDEAVGLAQTAVQQFPNAPESNDTLGLAFYAKGLPGLAVNPFLRSTQLDPRNPIYRYHLGLAYSGKGDKAHARVALQEALRLSPHFEGSDNARRLLDGR